MYFSFPLTGRDKEKLIEGKRSPKTFVPLASKQSENHPKQPTSSDKKHDILSEVRPLVAVRRQKFESKINGVVGQLYEPVDAGEIRRQRNKKALKQHLRDLANHWENAIDDLNTLRRGQVLKELRRYLKVCSQLHFFCSV